MATRMNFGLLGPLTVCRDGVAVTVPPGKQRIMLAVLLLKAGRVVLLDELAEALWGPHPPVSARATMQGYVTRLRKSLDKGRIITQPGGYQISVDPGELDVSRCEALVVSARAAARDGCWDAAAGQARAALALWRGEPLEDVASELLAARDVPRLAELRLQALEVRIGADLHLGRHGEVIGELRQLAGVHPLRERLHGLLMLALYRDGRQGEALAAYQRARRLLVGELGTEPGTELRELHQQILTGDPALAVAPPGRAIGGAAAGPQGLAVVPRQLPAAVADFTGRAAELRALT